LSDLSYEAREGLETMRLNIETKRCLTMVLAGKGASDKDDIKIAQKQVCRIEYRLGKIAMDCEEGSVKCLEHLLHGCFSSMFGGEAFGRVSRLGEVDEDVALGGSKLSELIETLEVEDDKEFSVPVQEKIDALNTSAIAYANREKLDLALELLKVAELLYTRVVSKKGEAKVRQSEERSDELITPSLVTQSTRARTPEQDFSSP